MGGCYSLPYNLKHIDHLSFTVKEPEKYLLRKRHTSKYGEVARKGHMFPRDQYDVQELKEGTRVHITSLSVFISVGADHRYIRGSIFDKDGIQLGADIDVNTFYKGMAWNKWFREHQSPRSHKTGIPKPYSKLILNQDICTPIVSEE